MTLLSWQEHMQRALLEETLSTTKLFKNDSGLKIYRNAYASRHHEVIAECFRATRKALGEKRFETIFESFLTEFRSTSYSIDDVAGDFFLFMEHNKELFCKTPCCLDIVSLEWQKCLSFYADNLPCLSATDLQKVTNWEELRFCPHPATKVIDLNWQVVDFVARDMGPGFSAERCVERFHSCCVCRSPSGDVHIFELDEKEAICLKSIFTGETLAASLPESADEIMVTEWFARWMRLGVFASFIASK